MGAPYNDLNSKLEEALKSVVDGLSLTGTVTVNTGLDADDLDLPYVVCLATGSGGEEVKGTGIFRMSAEVIVATSADDTNALANHRTNVATVFDAFMDDGIAATLAAAVDDFYCYDVTFESLPAVEAERKLMNTMEIEAVVCATDITAA